MGGGEGPLVAPRKTSTLPGGEEPPGPGRPTSVACAGDVNADGFADVIIGAHADGNGYDGTGSVYLYFGGASGISTSAIVIPNPTADSGGAWGAFVGGGGDVDADMLAATNNNSYVILGGPAGPRTVATLLNVPGGGQNFDFGQGALGAGGDVDGDGFADLLAGAPDSNGYAGSGAANFFGASVARLVTLRPRRAKPG